MLVTSLRCRTPRLLFRPQLAKASSCFLCKRKTRPQMFEPPAGPTRPMCSAAPPPPAATSAAAATSVSVVVSQPPMAVRAALVGTSIGFGTPFFAVGGVANLWYRYLPSTLEGKLVKYVLGVVLGGGGTVLLGKYVVPFMYNHSEFLLPFALANGLTATFWYTVGEIGFGLESMIGSRAAAGTAAGAAEAILAAQNPMLTVLRSLPIAGCAIGTLTAVTTHFLWEPMINLCWGEEFKSLILGNTNSDITWIKDLYTSSMYLVTIPISVLAGSSMHFLLKPLLCGSPGVAWQSRTLPAFLGLLGVTTLYYTVCKGDENDWWWHVRVDPVTGKKVSHNFNTQVTVYDAGTLGNDAVEKRSWITLHHVVLYAVTEAREQLNRSTLAFIGYVDWLVGTKFLHAIMARKEIETHVLEEGAARASGGSGTTERGGDGSGVSSTNAQMKMDGYNFPRAPRNLSKEAQHSLHASHDRDVLYHLVDRLVRLKHLDLELQRVSAESENNISFEPDGVQIVEERQRELDIQKHQITEWRKAFITASNHELHLKDLVQVLHAAEMGVCAINASILCTDIDTTSEESGITKQIYINEESVLSDVQQKLRKQLDKSANSIYTAAADNNNNNMNTNLELRKTLDTAAYSLALLQQNFDILQAEFHQHLQYDITQEVDIVQQVNSFQRAEKIRRAMVSPASLGVLATVGAAIGYVFFSSRS